MQPHTPFTTVLLTDSAMLNSIIAGALNSDRFDIRILKSDQANFLEEIIDCKPHLLFLRTELRSANGIEICDQVKQNKDLKNTRVIFLSANNAIRQLAIQHLADRFLKMPFSAQEVKDVAAKLTTTQSVILYVDDSDMFHEIVSPALRDEGYHVLDAWDGREALAIIDQEEKIDLILSDVEMPVMDGLQLCRNVRQSLTEDIPFLLLTSLNTEDSISKGFEAGANDYIVKPVVIPELLTRVKRLLAPIHGKDLCRHEKILVVDDSAIIRQMIVKALQTHAFPIDEAKHGLDALAKLREQTYSLMVTDYEMPHMDGVELCVKIRNEEGRNRRIPIIFVSSHDSPTNLVKMRSIGIQAFIAKPFDADRIIAEVERVLVQAHITAKQATFGRFFAEFAVPWVKLTPTDEETIADDQFRTILCVSLVNFPQLCQQLTSVELVTLLNQYTNQMVGVLSLFDTAADQSVADQIYTSFGRQDEGAFQAIQTALAMIKTFTQWQKKSQWDVRIQIGIHSGHVILGNINTPPHGQHLTLLGETVHLANLVSRCAPSNGIFLSETTRKILDGKGIHTEPTTESLALGNNGTLALFKLAVQSPSPKKGP